MLGRCVRGVLWRTSQNYSTEWFAKSPLLAFRSLKRNNNSEPQRTATKQVQEVETARIKKALFSSCCSYGMSVFRARCFCLPRRIWQQLPRAGKASKISQKVENNYHITPKFPSVFIFFLSSALILTVVAKLSFSALGWNTLDCILAQVCQNFESFCLNPSIEHLTNCFCHGHVDGWEAALKVLTLSLGPVTGATSTNASILDLGKYLTHRVIKFAGLRRVDGTNIDAFFLLIRWQSYPRGVKRCEMS